MTMLQGRYHLKELSNGEFHFTLSARNGEVILSSERYTAKRSALNGIESVRQNSPFSWRYQDRTSRDGEPYFVLVAVNGEVIGVSEMYSSTWARANGIESVKEHGPNAELMDHTLSSQYGF